MFWDNVLFASKMGNQLYYNDLFNWTMPDSFDPGHPPFLGFLLAITWKIFYRVFFKLNNNKKKYVDVHNFHYVSKYKHMVPLISKKVLIDYEVLIKKKILQRI